jgi:hypothetical protein
LFFFFIPDSGYPGIGMTWNGVLDIFVLNFLIPHPHPLCTYHPHPQKRGAKKNLEKRKKGKLRFAWMRHLVSFVYIQKK